MRCRKANTKTPRSFARLDPVFPRDCSGRSVIFTIKEEPTRLVTSAPFSERPNRNEPSKVGLMLPPTRAPLMKTPTRSAVSGPSSRTLTHVYQAAYLPVEQVQEPDTVRRTSGDATASRPISWTLFPYIYGRIASLGIQEQFRAPCPFGPS